MDKDVIKNKIESLIRCLNRINEKKPESVDILKQDLDIQDIISINIERAVQLSVDIGSHILADYNISTPKTMSNVFIVLAQNKIIDDALANKLAKAVDFRNIAVHSYQTINWETVFQIITNELEDFKQFIKEIMKLL
jgi:uncharacterized protein YutE (UPF0331/DUF86 family)